MTAPSTWERVDQAAADIRRRSAALPETAVVLGSGLGDFSDTLLDAIATSYAEVPHWPASNVVGHAGRLVLGAVAVAWISIAQIVKSFYRVWTSVRAPKPAA